MTWSWVCLIFNDGSDSKCSYFVLIWNLNFFLPFALCLKSRWFLYKILSFLDLLVMVQHGSKFSHYCYCCVTDEEKFLCVYCFLKCWLSTDHLKDWNSSETLLETDLDWFRKLHSLGFYIMGVISYFVG